MDKRGEGKTFESLVMGEFRPLNISKDVQDIFEIQAAKLGMADPYASAESVIDNINELLSTISLAGDFFPDIDNPLRTLNLPPLPDFTTELPDVTTLTAPAPGFTGQANVNTNAVNQANLYSALYPNDDLARLYNLKQNQKPNRIV